MSTNTPALQYRRRWSRKNLHAIHCISLSQGGRWVAVAEAASLLLFDADNGELAIVMESPDTIAAISWISESAMVCCCTNSTIMTAWLREVRGAVALLQTLIGLLS